MKSWADLWHLWMSLCICICMANVLSTYLNQTLARGGQTQGPFVQNVPCRDSLWWERVGSPSLHLQSVHTTRHGIRSMWIFLLVCGSPSLGWGFSLLGCCPLWVFGLLSLRLRWSWKDLQHRSLPNGPYRQFLGYWRMAFIFFGKPASINNGWIEYKWYNDDCQMLSMVSTASQF